MAARGADPYLDDGMVGFIEKFARKNHWRVASWLDLDDLIQEGWMCYYAVRRHPKYASLNDKAEPTPDDVRQVAAMVRTTLVRRMHTLANSLNAVPESALSADGSVLIEDVAPPQECANGVAALLAGAPREVVELAQIFAGDVVRAAGYVRDAVGRRETTTEHRRRLRADGDGFERERRGRLGRRETTNEMYCRLLGRDPREEDVRGLVLNYLHKQT